MSLAISFGELGRRTSRRVETVLLPVLLTWILHTQVSSTSWLFGSSDGEKLLLDTTGLLPEASIQATRSFERLDILGIPPDAFADIEKTADKDASAVYRHVYESYFQSLKHGDSKETTSFHCFDTSNTVIVDSKVNDDYCDCENGMDEPGTSACSHVALDPALKGGVSYSDGKLSEDGSPPYLLKGFYCPNVGYKSVYIPFSRVNDGICDCCDGSDENFDSPLVTQQADGNQDSDHNSDVSVTLTAACQNSCEHFGHTYREQKAEQAKHLVEGLRIKGDYVLKGKQAISTLKTREQSLLEKERVLKAEVKSLEAVIGGFKEVQQKVADDKRVSAKTMLVNRVSSLHLDLLQRSDLEDLVVSLAAVSGLGMKLEQLVNELLVKYKHDTHLLKKKCTEKSRTAAAESAKKTAEAASPGSIEHAEQSDAEECADRAEQDKRIGRAKAAWIDDASDMDPTLLQTSRLDDADVLESFNDDDDIHLEHDPYSDPYAEGDAYAFPYDEVVDDYADSDEDPASLHHETDETDSATSRETTESSDTASHGSEVLASENEVLSRFKKQDDVKALNEEVKRIRTKAREVEKQLEEVRKDKETDYGPEAVLYTLKNKCFGRAVGKYKYEVCLFDRVKQDNMKLGVFSKFETIEKQGSDGTVEKEMVMQFTKGTKCWNGPYRALTLKLACGKEEQLGEVTEPSMCQYEAVFTTPAAC